VTIDRLLGLLGLCIALPPYIALLVTWLAQRRPARRLLRFDSRCPAEFIVSTNSTQEARPGEAAMHTTAIGELRATAVGARRIFRLYRKKKISFYMSEEYPERLRHDLVVLGGPLRNAYAEKVIERVNDIHPEMGLSLDAERCRITLGGRVYTIDQQLKDGLPARDLGLLVLACDLWGADRGQRVVLCAGLSTYGTEGAARFLFEGVLGHTRRSRTNRGLLSGPASAVVVRVDMDKGKVVHTAVHDAAVWNSPLPRAAQTTAAA
jgi:hypothetical protein